MPEIKSGLRARGGSSSMMVHFALPSRIRFCLLSLRARIPKHDQESLLC
jgi:hypothetical protein